MKKPSRTSRYAFTVLILTLMPFVVAFDFPDSTGIHAKVSAGRGSYSISSCSRTYQSRYVEENVALRATFATGSEEDSGIRKLRPAKTTIGGYGNFAQEELLLVREDGGAPDNPGRPKKDQGKSVGAYAQFDWKWFGLQAGGVYLSQWETDAAKHSNNLLPTCEFRAGPEWLYGSAAIFSSSPVLSGGGGFMGGMGGRIGTARMWAGYSFYPGPENALALKLSQKFGPVTLSFAGQLAIEPSIYDDARNHGVSLGLEVPLPGPFRN